MLSYFLSKNLLSSVINDPKTRAFYLPPDGLWHSHNVTYSDNEKSMVDYDGKIEDKRDRTTLMIDEIPCNLEMDKSIVISNIESATINNSFNYKIVCENKQIVDLGSKC